MSSRRRTAVAAATATLLVASFAQAVSAGEMRPITFDVTLGDRCIDGSANDDAMVELVWKDASGDPKGRADVQASEFGGWFHCFPAAPGLAFAIGDRIKGIQDGSSRTFVVPRLTLVIDRTDDLFRGRAPADDRIRLHHAAPLSDVIETERDRANSNGRWSFDPDREIIGGYFVILEWRSGDGDTVWINGQAPQLTVTLGSARFSGWTRPERTIEVLLDRPAGPDGTGIDTADPRGRFAGTIFDGEAERLAVAPGDSISAPDLSPDAAWIVPQINGNANTGTDVVRGRCFDTGKSAQFVRVVVERHGDTRGFAIGSTGADGRFAVDFSDPPGLFFDPADIRSGDRITIGCEQEEGDWVQLRFTA